MLFCPAFNEANQPEAGCLEGKPTISAPDVDGVIEAVVDAGRPNIGAGRIAHVEKVEGVPVNARLAAVAKLHVLHLKWKTRMISLFVCGVVISALSKAPHNISQPATVINQTFSENDLKRTVSLAAYSGKTAKLVELATFGTMGVLMRFAPCEVCFVLLGLLAQAEDSHPALLKVYETAKMS